MSETAFATRLEEMPVARLYADAMWDAASKAGQEQALVEEIDSFVVEVIRKVADLGVLLTSGAIGPGKRSESIDRILKGRVSDLLLNLLHALNRRDRLSLLGSVNEALKQRWEASQNMVRVLVKSAVDLPPDRRQSLEAKLKSVLKKEPKVAYTIDPAILGGLWIKVGDRVNDYTVRLQLGRLKDSILARKPNEVSS